MLTWIMFTFIMWRKKIKIFLINKKLNSEITVKEAKQLEVIEKDLIKKLDMLIKFICVMSK